MPVPANAARFLGRPTTADYRPTAIGGGYSELWVQGQRGFFSLNDVPFMRRDPQCAFGMRILRAPIRTAMWEVEGEPGIGGPNGFVDKTLRRFWTNSLTHSLKMLDWGHVGGEPIYKLEENQITFDRLKPLHPFDCIPMEQDGLLAGLNVRGGNMNLRPPRSYWVVNESEFNLFYGKSRYSESWEAWIEKRGRHGAVDSRRLWAIKNAFTGGIMRYPPGETQDDAGVLRSNQDYARELLEKMMNGFTLVLPVAKDPETREFLWIYEKPEITGNFEGLIDYPVVLDKDILKGMGIPPEIVEAAETGSGWSGRSVPFLVFLTAEDEIVWTTIEAFDAQVIRPLVWVNYGPGKKYQVKPKSLVPVQEGGPGQVPGGMGAGGGLQPYQGPRGGTGIRDPNTGAIQYGDTNQMMQGQGPQQLQFGISGSSPLHWGEIVTHEAQHVRIVGETGSGKTTMAQALAAASDGQLYIIDPLWQPDHWGGLPAATVSPEGSYDPIDQAFKALLEEMKHRGEMLQKGVTEFPRLTILCDEVPDTVAELPKSAGLFIRRIAQRGRHANMHLIGMGQSDRVGAWGLEGYGDAFDNFTTIYLGEKALEKLPELAGQDKAGALDWRGKVYDIDLHGIFEMSKRPITADRLFDLPGGPEQPGGTPLSLDRLTKLPQQEQRRERVGVPRPGGFRSYQRTAPAPPPPPAPPERTTVIVQVPQPIKTERVFRRNPSTGQIDGHEDRHVYGENV